MKKRLVEIALFAFFLFAAMPALAYCPCNPCEGCDMILKSAGVIDYDKAVDRTNFGVIAKEDELNEFEKLIKISGLKHKVDKGEFTVFAPTNEAINKIPADKLEYLKKPENRDKLVRFVLAHMAPAGTSAQCICEQQVFTNLNCCDFEVQKCNNWLRIGNAYVIAPNITTENGTVHVINCILDPVV